MCPHILEVYVVTKKKIKELHTYQLDYMSMVWNYRKDERRRWKLYIHQSGKVFWYNVKFKKVMKQYLWYNFVYLKMCVCVVQNETSGGLLTKC